MLFGKRDGRSPDPRSRRRGARFRPVGDRLEARALLAAIDLTIGVNPGDEGINTTPYGVQEVGNQPLGGAGFSVANVGDTNGDGFDDFLIGAPTIDVQGGAPVLANGANSRAFLIFGSAEVGTATVRDFLQLTSDERIGNLGVLGQLNQLNPATGTPGFNYDGLVFQFSNVGFSQLGASVAAAGDVNGDGFADILIGAPGAPTPANVLDAFSGQAFLVYGGPVLSSRVDPIVDFGNPTSFADLNVLRFFNSEPVALTRLGRSVANAGDFLPDGLIDLAIGAPGSSLNGLAQSGAVYIIPGTVLRPARTQDIDVATIGQPGGTPGIVFTGQRAGQGAGYSVSSAGNVDGRVPGQPGSADLLIGAPDTVTGVPGTATGPGRAYLIYGSGDLVDQPQNVNGSLSITLDRVGATDVLGAQFLGQAIGDLTGLSVSVGGDFNGDQLDDFLIGSPGFNNFAGRAHLFYGQSATANPLLGTYALSNLPSDVLFAEFDGTNAGDLAGFGVGATGFINNDQLTEILIGTPGFNGGVGAAYLIPGNTGLFGVFPLDPLISQVAPVSATVIGLGTTSGQTLSFLGTSVGGRPFGLSSGFTVDRDSISDFAIGAPGFALTSTGQGGSGYILEGAFVPLATPVDLTITSPIGVEGVRPPFIINATTPDDLQIFILSAGSNTTGFVPPADLDPSTILVNGVPLPDPSTFANAGDLDGDGIADASFIFSPRSLLNLPRGTNTITVNARTFATSPLGNRLYQGSATVTVTTTSGGGGAVPGLPQAFGGLFGNLNAAAPRFGERFLPSPSVIGRPQWKPLSPRLAYRQFLPQGAFGFRLRNFFHPDAQVQRQTGPTRTLPRNVFTRGRFPVGAFFGRINHGGPVVGQGNA